MRILSDLEKTGAGWFEFHGRDYIVWIKDNQEHDCAMWANANVIMNRLYESKSVLKSSIEMNFDKICCKVAIKFRRKR